MPHRASFALAVVLAVLVQAGSAAAQAAGVTGTVRDQIGGALPGVVVELTSGTLPARRVQTDAQGRYAFDAVPAGPAALSFALINFGVVRRDVAVPPAGRLGAD